MEKLRMAVDNTGACTCTIVRKGNAVVERASRDSILSIELVELGSVNFRSHFYFIISWGIPNIQGVT